MCEAFLPGFNCRQPPTKMVERRGRLSKANATVTQLIRRHSCPPPNPNDPSNPLPLGGHGVTWHGHGVSTSRPVEPQHTEVQYAFGGASSGASLEKSPTLFAFPPFTNNSQLAAALSPPRLAPEPGQPAAAYHPHSSPFLNGPCTCPADPASQLLSNWHT